MKTKPVSVLRTIAKHYAIDARDFAARFDALWEDGRLMHKTGRIKSFVDLLMACECALKAHVALGRLQDNPEEVYETIRNAGHRIALLSEAAKFLDDRSSYDALSSRLDQFSVFIRYSLDAYEAFFPMMVVRDEAALNYSGTIGNNSWVLETRALLGDPILTRLNDELSGFVTDDIGAIFDNERQVKELMDSFTGRSSGRRRKARPSAKST